MIGEFIAEIVGTELVQRLTAPVFRRIRSTRPIFLVAIWSIAIVAFLAGGYLISRFESSPVQGAGALLIFVAPLYALCLTIIWLEWRRESRNAAPQSSDSKR